MINRKFMLMAIFLVSLIAMSAVSANDLNATDEVAIDDESLIIEETSDDVSQDDVLGVKDDGTFTALQNKIDGAAEGSTITLENDYTYNEGFDTKGIRINKVLTINGNGHSLNGLSKSRIMFVTYTQKAVTLNEIKFYNGYADEGGAIDSEGSGYDRGKLTVNNCEFINNKATSRGSAIIGSYLTISNSRFADNNGSGAVLAMFTTDVINCNFENNNGNALMMSATDDGHELRVINCIFKNNNGEAIYSNSEVNISSSTFDSNVYDGNGGAVYVFGELTVSDSTFTNNQAFKSGGAIFHETEKLYIKNSTFLNNKASENGGAVYTSGYKEIWSSSTGRTKVLIYEGEVENSEFTCNSAGNAGGAIYSTIHTYGGVNYGVTVTKSIFSKNAAPEDKDISGGNAIDCIFKANIIIDAADVDKYYGGSEKFTVKITKDDKALSNANVKITVNGKTSTVTTDSNGRASLDLNLPVGTHDAVTECEDVKATSKVTVKSTVTASDAAGEYLNSKVSAAFLNVDGKALASKQVTFKIGDKSYSATTNANGAATANIDLGTGTYDVSAVNLVNKEEKQFKLIISKADSKIALDSSQNRDDVTLTATLTPASATGSVFFNVNGANRNVAIKNGKATLTLNDLEAGDYVVTASYNGDANLKTSSSNTVNFKVAEVYPVLTADDFTKIYGNANKFVVSLKDSKGNAIANAVVNVNINGQVTPITTDSNGEATLDISLKPAEYTATATYADVQDTAKITVKKATPKITASKKAFKVSVKTKKYTITLKTNKNKVMKNKKVTLKVNGKTYSAKTNSNGKATFKITKLTKKGSFNTVIKFAGNSYYNKVTKTVKITVKK